MENKRKHLELIQGIIGRMASNLFFLKGWTITLIVALFALFTKDLNQNFIQIIYFLVLIFWILDGYFLSQERLFRSLYNHVRTLDEIQIDFSMETDPFKKGWKTNWRNSWIGSMFSTTLLFFYLSIIIVTYIIGRLLT